MSSPKHRVLITGANGFVAIHIISYLLERGHSVVGTVRSHKKGRHVLEKFKGQAFEIVIVEELQAKHAFDKIFQEDRAITAVIHTASPLVAKKDPLNQILIPAIEGTKNLMTSIQKNAPQVTKFVYTSSVAAAVSGDQSFDKDTLITEESWNPVTWEEASTNLAKAYEGSKKFSELEIWRFLREKKPNFTATLIAGPMAIGPIVTEVNSLRDVNDSNKHVFNYVFRKKPPGFDYSNFVFWCCDVRDYALAHVLSIERPEFANLRLILGEQFVTPQIVLDFVNKRFPELRGKVPEGKPGTGERRKPEWLQVDVSKTMNLLGFKYISIEQSVVDTMVSYLEIRKKFENQAKL